jgi:dipeptidyl aminopeptidase/acylaminoacyl peptidase
VNLDNGELLLNGIKDTKSYWDYLVNAGVADQRRIGITGGSYRGYMTLEGDTEFPDLLAAGVNLFRMVNFFRFFAHTVLHFLDLPRKVANLESNQFDRRQEFCRSQVILMELTVQRTQASDVLVQPLSWRGHGSILTYTSLTSFLLNLRF